MFAASKTDSASTGDYQISRSLRFNSADSATLNRTPATATNRRTWTYSTWIKRGLLTGTRDIFSVNGGSFTDALFLQMYLTNTGDIQIVGGVTAYRVTTQVFRDPSAWYHFVLAWDTTQATANNRVKFYVNGAEVTAFATLNNPTQNFENALNNNITHYLGTYNGSGELFDGYMTETNLIDGQALTPSSFGETNAQTGVWKPKAFSGGAYGTNGFYVNFSDNSNTTAATLGKDYSGNGNNWTPNNFSVTAGAGNDSMVDVPTPYGTDTGVGGSVRGNYCTLNPLNRLFYTTNDNGVYTNGNLDFSTSVGGLEACIGTIAVSSGKWYWEVTQTAGSGRPQIGICQNTDKPNINGLGGSATAYIYESDQYKANNGNFTAYGDSYTIGDVIGVALDMDAGTITFYKNNASQGTAFTSLVGNFSPACGEPDTGGSVSVTFNFGQRAFAYTAPSGFKALCTQNLPTPTIGATSATLASQFFAPVLYTGNGATQSITVGFQPDFVWYKSRSSGVYNHGLFDSVRGVTKQLFSNTTGAEGTFSGVTAFNSGGFSVGSDNGGNESGGSMVAWNWKASNATAVTNTSGTITSTVSANTTSGFSIVTYNGQSAAGTVGHGLGVAPSMIIIKSRTNTYGWIVWHSAFNQNEYLILETTDAKGTTTDYWNSSTPSTWTSAFGVGASPKYNNADGQNHVAYCFAAITGYSAFGSYTGNGSADGPFVFTGFRPAYVLVKRSSSAGTNWQILDTKRSTYNVMANYLYASTASAEGYDASVGIDSLSNGFKIRGTDGNTNTSTATYIYMAFAESPFKYSLAR